MCFGFLVIAVLVFAVAAADTVRSDSFDDGEASVPVEILAERANQVLGLLASDIVTLEIDRTPTLPIVVTVPIAGQLLTLDLVPHSVRAPGYNISMQIADGSFVTVEPGPVRTLRGSVVGVADSSVTGSMEQEGLLARINLPNGQEYWIEPAAPRVAGASSKHHVVYNHADVIPSGGMCAAEETMRHRPRVDFGFPSIAGAACGTGICLAELACDADVEFFEDFGSVAGVESRINSVINIVNTQYEEEVQITHEITTILVRTEEPDPYSSTNSSTLLGQFRAHWNANHGNIQRDVAELFTGKDLQGNIIGIAYLNGLCGSFGYNVVENNYNGINGNFSCKTDLSAHELGHNWSANHCSCSNPPFTMFQSILCSNRFHENFTIPEIQSFRDSRTCLDPFNCETPADCDDGNACTDDFCNAPVCSHINNTNPCDDGDPCTLNDVCGGGSCDGDAIVCEDGDPCTNDSCSGGICQFNDVDCNDFNACTDDVCLDGDCRSSFNNAPCNDFNSCTVNDVCDGGQCSGEPMDCDDGDPCTTDSCFFGACQNSEITCNDNNLCTDDACVGGICEFTHNNTACDDGNGCTENDACSDGLCSGTPVDCDDGDPCTTDSCTQGACSNIDINCDDGSACTDDSCGANGCQFTNNQNACDDVDPCTVDDQCVSGICVGTPIDCDDGNSCTDNACDVLV